MSVQVNQVSNQEAAITRAKELLRNVMEAKQKKAEYDQVMKEAIAELEQLAIENKTGWFTDRDTDEVRKSCDFGIAKLVWKTTGAKYAFKSIVLSKVVEFAKKYPNSIKFELKSMTNIDLEQFGIEKIEGKETLHVE
jgi:hypothetical protein